MRFFPLLTGSVEHVNMVWKNTRVGKIKKKLPAAFQTRTISHSQSHLRDPPAAHTAVATEPLHRRGARQETAGAYQAGPAERPFAPHWDGAALPWTGGHHRQSKAAGGSAGRRGEREQVLFSLGAKAVLIPQLRTTCVCVLLQVNEGDEDTDLQIFCVSCSHPVNPKVALRHMERCYAKVMTCVHWFLINNSLYHMLRFFFVFNSMRVRHLLDLCIPQE